MSSVIYDVILKRHNGSSRPDVCIFYDEDKELAIAAMANYDRKNAFTITKKMVVFLSLTSSFGKENLPEK